MADKTNAERLAEEGLLTGDLSSHHTEAINALSEEETDQLISILKKIQETLPGDRALDQANIV